MNRIDANREIYEQWPIEMKQAVLDGKVEEGMTPEMVMMAIGKPTEVNTRSGTPQTGDDEVWVYRTGGVEQDPNMYPGAAYPGGGYPGSTYPGAAYPGGMYPGSTGAGIVMSPGRGGGIAVIPPSVGIGIGGGTGISGGIGGMGGGYPGGMGSTMPMQRTPVEEREVVFRNGVVLHADPGPEK